MGKKFHIGDVLSVSTGYLVSKNHIGGVYAVLNFMTNDSLSTLALVRACKVCRPALFSQHPWLQSPEMDQEFAKLEAAIQTPGADVELVAMELVANMSKKHGEEIEIEPLPKGSYKAVSPETELNMMGVNPDKLTRIDI